MVVNHNIPALQSYNALSATNSALQKSIQKLSTGLRINSAADDAAGLAISEKMRAQIRGLDRAVSNAQDGISMIQTAEGALSETHSILQRMRELSVQAANDTLTQQDRAYIQLEIDELREEVTRIGNTTQFNKKKLLDGSAAVLWSAGDSDTKAIVNGGLRTIDQFGQKSAAEGNYKITIEALSGSGQVQKTDIFKIKHEASQTFTLGTYATASTGEKLVTSVVGTNLTGTEAAKAAYSVSGAGKQSTGGANVAAISNYLPGGTTAALGTDNVGSGAVSSTTNSMDPLLGGASVLAEVVANDGTNLSLKVTANITMLDGTSRTLDKVFTVAGAGTIDLAELDSSLKGTSLKAGVAATTKVGAKSAVNIIGDGGATAGTTATASVTIGVPATTAPANGNYKFNVSDAVAGKTVDYIVYSVDKATGDITNNKISITYGSEFTGALMTSNAGSVATLSSDGSTLKWGLIGDEANANTKLYDIDKFWDA
jgi:flagellin